MADILIRDVPNEVVAAVDANAQRSGQTRAEYLRRLLADQQRPALTREQLNRFAERTADLGNPEVMAALGGDDDLAHRQIGAQPNPRSQHRAPSIPDLLIAATAELSRLTVLHVDKNFDLIAAITDQPIERLGA